MTVKKLVIRSSMWIFGGQIISQLLRLVSNLITTRLLVPEMFGVMAVANTVIMGLSLCSYFGVHHNIIQSSRGDERAFLDTAWTMTILRGALIFVAALCFSGLLYLAQAIGWIPSGSAYAEASLPAIIAVVSLSALISGFESTKLANASRHMAQGKLTLIDLGSQVLGLIAMITFAKVSPTIWALVLGSLVPSLSKTVVSHFALPGVHNKFAWEKSAVKELFGFGKWILLTTIISFFVKSGDKLLLAGLVSAQLLGIYTIAVFMIAVLQDVMGRWVHGVALPMLSRVQRERPDDLINVYYKFRLPFDAVMLFLCGFIYRAGYIFTDLLYDSRYESAGAMISILSVGLLGARTNVAEQCYYALGKSKQTVPMYVIQLIVLFGFMIPAYRYFGMDGALYVISGSVLFTLPYVAFQMKKFGLFDLKKELITLPMLALGYGLAILVAMAYESLKLSFK